MKVVAEGILIREGEILMGRRAQHKKHYPDMWSFPGGHVEAGETIDAALVRELREEIGVEATTFQSITMIEDLVHDIRFHIYRVTEWMGNVANLGDEHSELDWVPLDKAHALPDLAIQDYLDIFDRLRSEMVQ